MIQFFDGVLFWNSSEKTIYPVKWKKNMYKVVTVFIAFLFR